MTAIGHFSVISQTEYNPSIVTFFMGMTGKTPLTAREFGTLWKERGVMERHERFHQKVWGDEYFVPKGSIDDDRHPVEDHLSETVVPNRADVVGRMKALQTTTWDLTDSLWHIWIAPWGALGSSGCIDVDEEMMNASKDGEVIGESFLFFQGHHALGDGASMSAAFMDVVDEAEEIRQEILNFLRNRRRKGAKSLWQRFCQMWRRLIWFVTGTARAVLHQAGLYWSLCWDRDPWSRVRQLAEQAEVKNENQPVDRTLSWVRVLSRFGVACYTMRSHFPLLIKLFVFHVDS
jgi:hypothetical protein